MGIHQHLEGGGKGLQLENRGALSAKEAVLERAGSRTWREERGAGYLE